MEMHGNTPPAWDGEMCWGCLLMMLAAIVAIGGSAEVLSRIIWGVWI